MKQERERETDDNRRLMLAGFDEEYHSNEEWIREMRLNDGRRESEIAKVGDEEE